MLSKINVFNYLSVVIVFMLSTIAFYYGYKVHSSIIRADEWRFLQIYLIPLYDGTFSWKMLFADQHGNFLDGLIFIANALYFDLTGDLFFYIGIFSKISIFIIIAFILNDNFNDNKLFYAFSLLVIGTTFFSLKGTMEYQWPLVTRAYLFLLMFVVILYFTDKYLKQEDKSIKNIIAIFVFSILLSISIKTASLILIGSIMGLLGVLAIVDRHNRRKFLTIISLFVLTIVLIKIFWYIFVIDTSREVSNKIDFSLFSIVSFFQSYGLALLSGLVNIEILNKKFEPNNIILFSYLYLIIYLFVMFYSIKKKTYEKTLVPLAMMAYPLLFILGVLIYRYFPIQDKINWLIVSPRYIKSYEFGAVGLLWNILLIYDKVKLDRWKNNMLISLGFLFILINIYYMYFSYKTSNAFVKAFSNADEKIYYYAGDKDSLPKWLKGGYFSDEKVDFLKKHKLNIFSDKYNMIDKR